VSGVRFTWPLTDHYITRGFDYKSNIYIGGMHAALDLVRIYGDTAGRKILAVADGVVVGDAWDRYSGYFIILEHATGWRSMYRHMVTDAPPVVGQQIAQGQTIGNVGSTGLSMGPHLHFDLWHRHKQDGTAFSKSGWWAHNPELYLGQEDDMDAQEVRDIVRAMKFHSEDREGNQEESVTTLSKWFGVLNEHRKDGAEHDSGGISEARARAIAQEEDKKLKVTK
jgi:murein DD-endopeptidase MepM/ murein hydrolase activator NlpD